MNKYIVWDIEDNIEITLSCSLPTGDLNPHKVIYCIILNSVLTIYMQLSPIKHALYHINKKYNKKLNALLIMLMLGWIS